MDGIFAIKDDEHCVFYIEHFSGELKSAIKENLALICHGPADVGTGRDMYSYKATLIEFIKRYNNKTDKQKKGLIGELILHILIQEKLKEYSVSSPFFNIEERSVKKGFDVVLNHSTTNEMWITEVKSGNLHANKDSSQTIVELINNAKNDLEQRLNGDSVSLWHNAINGAKKVLEDNSNSKKAIISILQDNGDAASSNLLCSNDVNTILVGALFHDLNERFSSEKVLNKKRKIDRSRLFNSTYIIAIQKKTYTAIFDFLKSESE